MSIISTLLNSLVALEFFYIMYLETFATPSATTAKVFNLSQEELKIPNCKMKLATSGKKFSH